jgi:hypothetical protein
MRASWGRSVAVELHEVKYTCGQETVQRQQAHTTTATAAKTARGATIFDGSL